VASVNSGTLNWFLMSKHLEWVVSPRVLVLSIIIETSPKILSIKSMQNIKLTPVALILVWGLMFQAFQAKAFSGPDQAAFWYSGHLLFDKEEYAAEAYWDLRKNSDIFFSRSYFFTGLGFADDFLFYEFPVGIGSDIMTFNWSKGSAGIGISLVESATTTGNTFLFVPPRANFNFPFRYDKIEAVIEYSINFGYGAMKWGLGIKYEY
jgi:hypothetical protein